MAIRLNQIRPLSLIPGRFVFTCIDLQKNGQNDDIKSFWLGLVINNSWAPNALMLKYAPTQQCHLIWVIGKGIFLCMATSDLYELDESQLVAFSGTDEGQDFTSFYRLAQNNVPVENLDMFKDAIAEDARRADIEFQPQRAETAGSRGARNSTYLHGSSLETESEHSRLRDSDDDQDSLRKKAKRFHNITPDIPRGESSSSPTHTRMTPSTAASPAPDPLTTAIVKHEPGEVLAIQREARLQVFVGPHNTEFSCDKTDVEKSPVLASLVIDQPGQGAFIMHPTLKGVDANDFRAVVEFLQTCEYGPCLVDAPAGTLRATYALDGLHAEEEYSLELVRSGRLHNLAKQIEMPDLLDLVFKKITLAQCYRYSARALLELAQTVFSVESNAGPFQSTKTVDSPESHEDALEVWLIEKLANDMRDITLRQCQMFWRVLDAGHKRGLAAKVFARKAAWEEKYPGGLVKLEDE